MRQFIYQRGAILIIVLWFLVILALVIGTLASEVRLSAQIAARHKQGAEDWGKIMTALRMAEMELMLQRMPQPPEYSKIPLEERVNPLQLFNGEPMQLSYPLPEGVTVRIYDQLGFLNLRQLNIQQWRDILRHRIGEDDLEQLDRLIQIWQDWVDPDDMKHLNGAEKEYYQKLEPPYSPRNAALETVDELLLLKDYADLFADINIHAAFTIRGSGGSRINPNLATPEALRLIPGMDEGVISEITARRRDKPFKNLSELQELMEPEQWAKISQWLTPATGNNYLIAVQLTPPPAEAKDEGETAPSKEPQYAYMEEVLVNGYAAPPKVLMVRPYGRLPKLPPEPPPEDADTE